MIDLLVRNAQKMKPWQMIVVSILVSETLAGFIVAVMDFLINGSVTWDFMFIGAVTALIVSFLVVSIIVVALNRIRENEERYRQIFQQATDYIIVLELSPDGPPVISDGNDLAFIKHGYTRDEMIGKPITFLDAEAADNDRVAEIMRLLMENKEARFEAEHVRKDGGRFFVEVNAKMMTISGKTVVYTIERDITERKALEAHKMELMTQMVDAMEEAQKANRLKSDAQKLAHLGNWELDLESMKLTWSDEIFRILGFEPGAFEPTFEKFVAVVHPADQKRVEGYLFEVMSKTLSHFELDMRIIRPGGEQRTVTDKLAAVRDANGKLIKLTGILQDITERKLAEEALRISALKHQLLFESSRDALMLLAPPSWKFTGANQATLQLFGASTVDEFTALGPWNVSPARQPDGRASSEKAPEMIGIAMREGAHFFEWEHQTLRGEPFPTDVLLTRMEVGGELFLQATVRDITERKREEGKLVRAKEAAEEANRLKSEFLANMSHELNTPLTSVLGYSRLASELDREAADTMTRIIEIIDQSGDSGATVLSEIKSLANSTRETAHETAKYDTIVLKQGEALFNMLNDLMDLSLLESGEIKVSENMVSTYMLLAHVERIYGETAKSKGLLLSVNISDFRPADLVFLGDQKKLEKALNNLVQNAIKYSDKGTIRVNASAEGEDIVFRVKDEGKGIQDREKEQIFETFRQLDGSSTRHQGGLGLGLSLARKLVHVMGGDIVVQSEVGKGSEFIVHLPYRPVMRE